MRPLKSGGKQVDEAVRFLKLLTIDSKLTKTLCSYGLSRMLQRFANALNCETGASSAAAAEQNFKVSYSEHFKMDLETFSRGSCVYPPAVFSVKSQYRTGHSV